MKLSIIVPVYNEKQTVAQILKRIEETPYDKEIIVVDDFSTDGTREILRQMDTSREIPSLRVLYHAVNQGKGAALRTGIAAATGDIVLIPPNEKHMTRNTGTEPLVLLCFFAEPEVTKGTTEFKSF